MITIEKDLLHGLPSRIGILVENGQVIVWRARDTRRAESGMDLAAFRAFVQTLAQEKDGQEFIGDPALFISLNPRESRALLEGGL